MRAVAGAGLFAGPFDSAWLARLRDWVEGLRAIGIPLHVTEHYWHALSLSGQYPDFATLHGNLTRSGLGAAAAPAAALAAAIVTMSRVVPVTQVIDSWKSDGCLATTKGPCDAVVEAIAELDVDANVAGSIARDEESLEIQLLWEDERDLVLVEKRLVAQCYTAFSELLPAINPLDFKAQPEVALKVVLSQMNPATMAGTRSFRISERLRSQLYNADRALLRRALFVMATVLGPKESWPKGLDEHALRQGPGGNDPPVTSSAGTGTRVTVSKHGAGWRLHFWLGADGVVFANLATHSETDIEKP